jgi:hypothetical protein
MWFNGASLSSMRSREKARGAQVYALAPHHGICMATSLS